MCKYTIIISQRFIHVMTWHIHVRQAQSTYRKPEIHTITPLWYTNNTYPDQVFRNSNVVQPSDARYRFMYGYLPQYDTIYIIECDTAAREKKTLQNTKNDSHRG